MQNNSSGSQNQSGDTENGTGQSRMEKQQQQMQQKMEEQQQKQQQAMAKRMSKQLQTFLKTITKTQAKLQKTGVNFSSDCQTDISDAMAIITAISGGSTEYDQGDIQEAMQNLGECQMMGKQILQVPTIYKILNRSFTKYKKNHIRFTKKISGSMMRATNLIGSCVVNFLNI